MSPSGAFLKKCGKLLKNFNIGHIVRNKSTPATHIILNRQYVEEMSDDSEWNKALPYEDIPGPKPLPILGNSWRFLPVIGNLKFEHIDDVCDILHSRYGPYVRIGGVLGKSDMLLVCDPDYIEKVFRSEDQSPHRPSMTSLNYYKHVLRKDFFGDDAGVIAVHGEKWNEFRSKVQQTMLQPRTAKLYIKQIEEAADALVERCNTIKDEKDEMPGDFLNELHKWSLESLASIALDTKLGCFDAQMSSDTQQLIDAVNTFFQLVPVLEFKISFWRWITTPNLIKYINALDTIKRISLEYLERSMTNKTENGDNKEISVMQRLIAMNNGDPRIAAIMAFDLFLVGIDTTSNTVASILYQLSQRPQVQKKLYEEVCNVFPVGDKAFTSSKLDKMQYLKALIKETLRMYPTVTLNGRKLTKNIVINGHKVPKGTQVIFSHLISGNSEKYFPNSKEFIPERWMKNDTFYFSNDNMDSDDKRISCPHHAFASLPFGFGKRMCLGRRFAELEIQAVVCKMVQNYKIEYDYEKLDYCVHSMYTPDGPLKLKLTPRLS